MAPNIVSSYTKDLSTKDKIFACKTMDTQDWVLGLVKSHKIHEQENVWCKTVTLYGY